MRKRIAFIVASWFGAGLIPCPGTFGSFAALPFIWAAAHLWGAFGVAAFALATFAVGLAATREVLRWTKPDPGFVVIDEACGMAVALLPAVALGLAWPWWAAAFVLFRFFDIVKPSWIGYIDRKWQSALGVMADDVLAGVFALACSLAAHLFSSFPTA